MGKTTASFFILTIILLSFSLFAQSFNWQADTTIITTTPDTTSYGKAVQFNTFVSNISNDTIKLRAIRYNNLIPNGWSNSICVGFCYPPSTDSIDFTIPMVGQDTLLELIFYVDSIPNSGTVGLKVKNLIDPSDYQLKDFTVTTNPVLINKIKNISREDFILHANYPNPFNPQTSIRYFLNNPARQNIQLLIFSNLGQLVRKWVNNNQSSGEYQITWDGKDQSGHPVASGVYYYQLVVGDKRAIQKMILLR